MSPLQIAGVTIPAMATVNIINKIPIPPHTRPPPINATPTKGSVNKTMVPTAANITNTINNATAATPNPNITPNQPIISPNKPVKIPTAAVTIPAPTDSKMGDANKTKIIIRIIV